MFYEYAENPVVNLVIFSGTSNTIQEEADRFQRIPKIIRACKDLTTTTVRELKLFN